MKVVNKISAGPLLMTFIIIIIIVSFTDSYDDILNIYIWCGLVTICDIWLWYLQKKSYEN